jgi:sulfate transport system ATP-binding protein
MPSRSIDASPVVSLAHVDLAYGSRSILEDLNLSVAAGEAVALVGRSGAGKSTTLKLINRLLLPDAGVVSVEGRDTREWNPIALRRRTGYVLQEIGLFPHLTIEDNVAIVARLEGWPETRRRARAHELLELVGLAPAEFARRWPRELSGGQRQRVGVARALAVDPPLLLMDEPFGALDAKVRKSLRIWLREVHDRMRLTSVFVTHDQAEAMEMADRVAVMRAGRIEQVDAPERLYATPATAFVHEFLGESVRLECHVAGGCAHIAGLEGVTLPAACPPGPAIALIRPHEIELLPGPGPALVRSVHLVGPLRRVRIELAGQEVEVLCPADAPIPAVGERCGVNLSRAKVYPAPRIPSPPPFGGGEVG